MRWSEADLKKTTKSKVIGVQASIGGPMVPKEVLSASRLDRVITSIQTARPEGRVLPGIHVEVGWPGMTLLTLNEMLRIDHRQLHAYRRACHDCAREALWSLAGQTFGLRFAEPVHMRLFRTGERLVDTDGLYASFKFLIDGFRHAGAIADDDPSHIACMTHEQSQGAPRIGVRIEVAALQGL